MSKSIKILLVITITLAIIGGCIIWFALGCIEKDVMSPELGLIGVHVGTILLTFLAPMCGATASIIKALQICMKK